MDAPWSDDVQSTDPNNPYDLSNLKELVGRHFGCEAGFFTENTGIITYATDSSQSRQHQKCKSPQPWSGTLSCYQQASSVDLLCPCCTVVDPSPSPPPPLPSPPPPSPDPSPPLPSAPPPPLVSCATEPFQAGTWYGVTDRGMTVAMGGISIRGDAPQSMDACSDWCTSQALEHCAVRESLLFGGQIRCGYDQSNQQCALFFGNNLDSDLNTDATSSHFAAASDCSLAISEDLTLCPPPPLEETCEGLGSNITTRQAFEMCSGQGLPQDLFEMCVYDACASDGGLDPDGWGTCAIIDAEEDKSKNRTRTECEEGVFDQLRNLTGVHCGQETDGCTMTPGKDAWKQQTHDALPGLLSKFCPCLPPPPDANALCDQTCQNNEKLRAYCESRACTGYSDAP